MVPLVRLELTTSPLPRVCSTSEPQRQPDHREIYRPVWLSMISYHAKAGGTCHENFIYARVILHFDEKYFT